VTTLYYVMDPMCSWCWAFRPVLERLQRELPEDVALRYVMGGLAPDSDEPMPESMQQYLQRTWRAIAERTGAEFNFEFWTRCRPRRSTWPACRAVIAAQRQDHDKGPEMAHAIQRAYYLEARNPSERDTLVALAGEVGLERERFAAELGSPEVERLLHADFELCRRFGIQGFPSLVLQRGDRAYLVARGYTEAGPLLQAVRAALAEEAGAPAR